jgi:hypothetical protein
MSADEFDPHIERLFGETPRMPDADLFHAEMQARLARGGRIRAGVMAVAGTLGGLVAVRELAGINLRFASESATLQAGAAPEGGLTAVAGRAGVEATRALEQAGLGQLLGDAVSGSLGGASVFIAAGLAISLLAVAAMRLLQEA